MTDAAKKLRSLLEAPGLLIAPGCYDALSGKLVEETGFSAAYMTGFGTSASAGATGSRTGVPVHGER